MKNGTATNRATPTAAPQSKPIQTLPESMHGLSQADSIAYQLFDLLQQLVWMNHVCWRRDERGTAIMSQRELGAR
jgi:hypothetical protein